MNIPETGSGVQANKKDGAKIIKWIIIIMVVLLLLIVVFIIYGQYTTATAFKVLIDGENVSKLPSDTFIIEGNQVKVQIKAIAPYLGEYSFKNGQYRKVNAIY